MRRSQSLTRGTGESTADGDANRAVPTERPDIGYAMVFPTVTVAKILFVQIAAAVLGS